MVSPDRRSHVSGALMKEDKVRNLRSRPRTSRFVLATSVLLAIVLVGCTPAAPATTGPGSPGTPSAPPPTQQPTASPSPGQGAGQPPEIAICLNADVTTLDTRVLTILNVRTILGNILDYPIQLANEGDDLVLKPHLVTSWENIDPLTWRLQLRQGVSFHNGEPFNAEAFKFSIETQKNATATMTFYLGNISEVRIIDEYTVDLITATPNPLTIPNLVQVYIYPPQYTQEVGEGFASSPVGTGPFKFVEWVQGDHVTLEANDDYWDTETWPDGPPVDQVVFRFCPDVTTRLAMLQRGEVDLIDNVEPEQVPEIEANPNLKTQQERGFKRIYMQIHAVPGAAPPLDDVRVRRAINHAVDRDAITQSLYRGLAVPYVGHTHEGLECRNTTLEEYAYDPDLARQLLSEAGYPDGFTIDLFTTAGAFPKDRDMAQAVAAQLAAVGITANIVQLEFNDYSTRFRDGDLPGLSVARRTTNTGDPADQFRFTSWRNASFNYVPDPAYDQMFEATETVTDLAARCEMLKDVEAYIWNEMVPQVALFDLVDVFGLNADLNWIPVNRRENIDLRGLQNNP